MDADDVVGGLRKRVEAELAARGVERATAEDISDVFEYLGPTGAGELPRPAAPARAAYAPSSPRRPLNRSKRGSARSSSNTGDMMLTISSMAERSSTARSSHAKARS